MRIQQVCFVPLQRVGAFVRQRARRGVDVVTGIHQGFDDIAADEARRSGNEDAAFRHQT